MIEVLKYAGIGIGCVVGLWLVAVISEWAFRDRR